jgi:hypothetical protein
MDRHVMLVSMNSCRLFPILMLLPLAATGCGSGSRTEGKHTEVSAETPVVFNLDMSTPLPLVSVLMSEEERGRLRQRYSSFLIEMLPPGKAGSLSLRFDKKGSLGNPWNFYLRDFSSPYRVRLVGTLPDGNKQIIHEETF